MVSCTSSSSLENSSQHVDSSNKEARQVFDKADHEDFFYSIATKIGNRRRVVLKAKSGRKKGKILIKRHARKYLRLLYKLKIKTEILAMRLEDEENAMWKQCICISIS